MPRTSRSFDFRKPVAYDDAAKRRFHGRARSQLRQLAAALRLAVGSYDLRSNWDGIAVSGEVILHSDRLYVQASQPVMGHDTGILFRVWIVRLKFASRKADAHLRYLQRDGTTRDGGRGTLYGPDTDQADGKSFLERGREDRHQFRFIIAPEDSERIEDLRGFTRDVMRQMQEDLGTHLDWVAIDHFNTGHPHSHVLIRGKEESGKDLIIAQDYITDGLRLRAQERVTLELGPETRL